MGERVIAEGRPAENEEHSRQHSASLRGGSKQDGRNEGSKHLMLHQPILTSCKSDARVAAPFGM